MGLYFDKKKTLATGLGLAGSGVGALIASPLTNALLEEYGLPGTFLVLAGICLNLCVAGMLLRPISFYLPKNNNTRNINIGSTKYEDTEITKGQINTVFYNEHATEEPDTVQNDKLHIDTAFDRGLVTKNTPTCTSTNEITKHHQTGTDQTDKSDVPVDKVKLTRAGEPTFDWTLLKLGSFWIIGLTFLLGFMGFFNMVAVLLPVHTTAIGLLPDDYALLTSLLGAFDIVGRIFVGWFGDLNLISKSWLWCVTSAISGTLVCCIPIVGDNLVLLAVLSSLIGFFGAGLPALQAAVLVERLSPEKLRSSLPLVQCLIGLPFLFSQPMAGENSYSIIIAYLSLLMNMKIFNVVITKYFV